MDLKQIQAQIAKNKIREGTLKKRSKFLKEWRERWVVLTPNFMFTFTDSKMKEVTDILQIRQIQGLKSYLKTSDDMTNNGFKVECSQNTVILMAADLEEKWSWLVTLQRLGDYKVSKGKGLCKNLSDVINNGFKSLKQFQEQRVVPQQQCQTEEKVQQQSYEEKKKPVDELMKLIELFKSQEQQNLLLRQQIIKEMKAIEQKKEGQQEIKAIQQKLNDHFEYTDNLQIQGIVKGIILCRRTHKQKKGVITDVIKQVLKDCKSEKVMNWGQQLQSTL